LSELTEVWDGYHTWTVCDRQRCKGSKVYFLSPHGWCVLVLMLMQMQMRRSGVDAGVDALWV
jgi:hypothetical protein